MVWHFSVDTIPPTITGCPSDIHESAEMGTSHLSVSWVEPSASDVSGDVRLSDVTHSRGDNFPVGSTLVKYTFVDSSDNSASCEFVIHVSLGKKLFPAQNVKLFEHNLKKKLCHI